MTGFWTGLFRALLEAIKKALSDWRARKAIEEARDAHQANEDRDRGDARDVAARMRARAGEPPDRL